MSYIKKYKEKKPLVLSYFPACPISFSIWNCNIRSDLSYFQLTWQYRPVLSYFPFDMALFGLSCLISNWHGNIGLSCPISNLTWQYSVCPVLFPIDMAIWACLVLFPIWHGNMRSVLSFFQLTWQYPAFPVIFIIWHGNIQPVLYYFWCDMAILNMSCPILAFLGNSEFCAPVRSDLGYLICQGII